MFADLLTSPRYKRLAADGESLQLPTSRRFYELTGVLLHEIRYATFAPAARPFAWPFTVRQDSTSREEVHQPPRGVLLAGGGVTTSASILSVADAAAAAAVAGLGCLERPEVKPSAAAAGQGGQPLDVLAVRLHCDAVTTLRVLRKVTPPPHARPGACAPRAHCVRITACTARRCGRTTPRTSRCCSRS